MWGCNYRLKDLKRVQVWGLDGSESRDRTEMYEAANTPTGRSNTVSSFVVPSPRFFGVAHHRCEQ